MNDSTIDIEKSEAAPAVGTLEFLSFTLGAEEYGIDIQSVQELRGYDTVTRIANAPDYIKGVVNLRGIIVPIVDMRIKLNLGSPTYDQFTVVIILNLGKRVVGMVVDSVSDVITLAREQIKPAPQMGSRFEADYLIGAAFDSNHRATTFSLVFSALALLFGVMIGWIITRSIRKQLGGEPAEAASVALRVAEGDLTAHVSIADGDTMSMMYAIKKMRDNLALIVDDVRSGTETIATASGQIASGNLDLSSRTEQQAASLEETASSMEELTSTVKQNADNSHQANQLALSASEVAVARRRGGFAGCRYHE